MAGEKLKSVLKWFSRGRKEPKRHQVRTDKILKDSNPDTIARQIHSEGSIAPPYRNQSFDEDPLVNHNRIIEQLQKDLRAARADLIQTRRA